MKRRLKFYKTLKVLVSDKRGCKRFKPKYEEQGKLLQDEKRGDINA